VTLQIEAAVILAIAASGAVVCSIALYRVRRAARERARSGNPTVLSPRQQRVRFVVVIVAVAVLIFLATLAQRQAGG
jgi:hypothetical protein